MTMANLFEDDMEHARRRPGRLISSVYWAGNLGDIKARTLAEVPIPSGPARDTGLDRERGELLLKDALRPSKPQDDIGALPLFGGPRQKGLF